MAKTARSAKLITPEGRVSYPHVFQSREFSGKKSWNLVLIFPKGADLDAMKDAAKRVRDEQWPDGAPRGCRSPFRKCSEKVDKNGNVMKGYDEGDVFVSFGAPDDGNRKPPEVVDNRKELICEKDGNTHEFYPGCYARVSCIAYAYDNMGNCGVSFGLSNIQKTRNGPALGSFSRAADDFDEVERDEEGWEDEAATDDGDDW